MYIIYTDYTVCIYIERERAVRSCRMRRCVSEFSESKLSLFFRSWVPTWSSRKPAKLKYRNGNPLGYVRIIWIIWIIWFIICFQNFQVFQGLSASHFLQSYLQQAARLVACRGHVRQSTKKNFHCDGTLANTNVLQKKTRLTMTNLQLVVYLEVNWGSHLNTASRAVPWTMHLLERVCCQYPSPGPFETKKIVATG